MALFDSCYARDLGNDTSNPERAAGTVFGKSRRQHGGIL